MKVDKLRAELAKAREKSAEWQARVRDLEKQVTNLEILEILLTVRKVATTPEDLRDLLDKIQTIQVEKPPQTTLILSDILPEKEDCELES